jgi:L-lactate dehydrogenase complex protein LldG
MTPESTAKTVIDTHSSRGVILARIREALRVPAPPPHVLDRQLVSSSPRAAAASVSTGPQTSHSNGFPALQVLPAEAGRPWLPDGGSTPDERLAILTDNLEKLRAEVHRCGSTADAGRVVAELARAGSWQRVAWQPDTLVESVVPHLPCDTLEINGSEGSDKHQLETCTAGITSCELLVAQTGSILVSSRFSGGRGLSILPHVHVVVARTDQIVGTLGDAMETIKERHGGHLPSMLSFITGPSRTGDIERILVLGAHGPKELHVVLIDE